MALFHRASLTLGKSYYPITRTFFSTPVALKKKRRRDFEVSLDKPTSSAASLASLKASLQTPPISPAKKKLGEGLFKYATDEEARIATESIAQSRVKHVRQEEFEEGGEGGGEEVSFKGDDDCFSTIVVLLLYNLEKTGELGRRELR
jgi:hypothetical protein